MQTLDVRESSSITEAPELPGERRRRRRQEAADALNGGPAAPSSKGHRPDAAEELLEAMRRICRA